MLKFGRAVRYYSTKYSPAELYECREWLATLDSRKLPRDAFSVSFSRSSGPGGQNVNKVNSKATVKLTKEQLDLAEWIPKVAKDQLEMLPFVTKSGSLVVQSDRSRNRHENIEDCYDKLCEAFKEGIYVESEVDEKTVKKWEQIKKKTNEERLKEKKATAEKKQGRKAWKTDFE
ncbi:hypothetical protein TRVA0_016S02146 [Trichomonascus vanleenenianus]|uniref:Pth4p n=1 Tax=Trichomonascus vanleenenianus TaxID=2268995 RepID=UPI003ECB60B4